MVGQRVRVVRRQVPCDLPDQAHDDHQDDRAREKVGGHGERPSRFLEAAQVAVAHQQDDGGRDLHLVGADHGEHGSDGRRARRDLDRNRHDVVNQQRHRANLRDPGPEILPGDYVGAAGPDVDHDDLAVGQHHEHHDQQDHARHGQDEAERREAGHRQQGDQDLFGAVRRGGDAVGGQHAQGERLGQPLLAELLVDERRAQQPAFRRIPEAPGQVDALIKHINRLAHGHRPVPFPSSQSD